MNGNILFMTGFPGFLATRILERILPSFEGAYLLVEERFLERAEREVKKRGWNVSLMPGDITKEGLGIKAGIAKEITHAFHLAAVYNLAVKRDLAYRVNVLGTRNVLDFLEGASSLRSFVYFSTAYVSGWRKGEIGEEELEDQGFKNWYEWSKFHAEVLVRERSREIPTIIIRPGIVVGNSRSGEIPKFDGPYYMMRLFSITGKLPLPYLGKENAPVNLVPWDFVVDAVADLWQRDDAIGKTFHLTDPAPKGSRELYRLFHRLIKGKEPGFTVPLWTVKAGLSLPLVAKFLKIPKQILPYLYHPQKFLTENASEFLHRRGIKPPPIEEYAPVLVEFFLKNRKKIEFVL